MKPETLRPLYNAFGRHATVYLETERRTPDAAHAIELRWREARSELAAAGAHLETLDAIAEVVANPDLAAPGRAVFARDGAVTDTIGLRTAPALPVAVVAPLPHVRPALADAPPAVPHLRVAVNRAGGEIITYYGPDLSAPNGARNSPSLRDGQGAQSADQAGRWALQEARRSPEINAAEWPLHKTSVGGWSQARYQRSAEHTWEENAKELAAQVAAEAEQARAEFIILGGDMRARGLLLDRLTAKSRDLVVVVDAEVAVDDDQIAAAAEATATRLASEECQRGLGQWRELAAHGQAAEGIAATISAVRDGQAASVFLGDDAALSTIAWLGVEGTDVATSQAELAERGVLAPLADRTDEAIIRAAATTDADLLIMPDDLAAEYAPKEGVCVTLRYPVPEPG
ncbi:MAG: baeRF2 domain-containing protein [Streptosporangiaceae bacterium]